MFGGIRGVKFLKISAPPGSLSAFFIFSKRDQYALGLLSCRESMLEIICSLHSLYMYFFFLPFLKNFKALKKDPLIYGPLLYIRNYTSF